VRSGSRSQESRRLWAIVIVAHAARGLEGPVNAFSLWKPEDVKVTAGGEHVATFAKTPMSERKFCNKCGGHLMANHPPLKMVDVFAATVPSLKFVPGVHVNYGETVLPMKDGLTKFNDFPSEFGGSGKTLPE
jgi:hypothetical protein